MPQNSHAEDFDNIISHSRLIAIEWKHNFIHCSHLFVAMLQNDCFATPFLRQCDISFWTEKSKNAYPPDNRVTDNDALPLTQQAERLIRQSYQIAAKNNETGLHSIYLLMALLSYENEIADHLHQQGICFENIAEQYFHRTIPSFPPVIYPKRTKGFSRIQQTLWTKAKKNKLLQDLLADAYNLLIYRQSDDCIATCKIGMKLDAGNKEWKNYAVIALMQKRDFAGAIPVLKSQLAEQPEISEHLFNLSYCYLNLAMYDEANEILNNLLLKTPDNSNCLNNKGFILLLQKKYEEAISVLTRATILTPAFAFPYNNLGMAKYHLGHTAEALSLIEKSLTLDKGNSFAYKNRGIIYMDQKEYEKARSDFQTALKFGYTIKYGGEAEQLLQQLP